MAIKNENEITVKVLCSNDSLMQELKNKGFKEGKIFTLDDYYLIPSNLDINKLDVREILSKAIIIRCIKSNNEVINKITFKKKIINNDGEIISQHATNCDISDINEARDLFLELNYKEIMNIKENDVIYYKDNIQLALKFIENGNTLIEFETNEIFDTVDKLKKIIDDLNIPIEKGNYFVKKAEIMLNRLLNN